MTELLKQTIKEEIAIMPKEWQEVVNASKWDIVSEEIGKKYFLTEENIEDLQTEIGLIIIGEETIDNLRVNIEYNLVISEDSAIKIRDEIIKKIFKPMFDMFTENIKKNLKTKSIHWQQNLNFILSGGDYTAFIKRVETEIKENPKPNNFNPSKIDDLKSKFTI